MRVSSVSYANNDARIFAEYCKKTLGLPGQNVKVYENATYGTMIGAVSEVFDKVVDPMLLVRRLNITVNNVVSESQVAFNMASQQLDLFTDYEAQRRQNEEEAATRNRERRMQQALLGIKKKFGKNAILRGLNFEDGATARERNQQIGGHKA